jgi:hypothetical protein
VKSIDTDENISSAMMETEIICINEHEKKSTEGTVGLPTDELKSVGPRVDQSTGKYVINGCDGW